MAEEALFNIRVLPAGDLHRDHLKVHHVMARWGLVALGTVLRVGRGMPIPGDRPRRKRVAACALAPEQSTVWIAVRMAGRAFKPLRETRTVSAVAKACQVTFQTIKRSFVIGWRAPRAGGGEDLVIHGDGPPLSAFVLNMTTRALAD